jgi:signal peptidase I
MVRFRAEGFSMYPAIRDGELITVAPVSAAPIARGDVLLFRTAARLLAHRVVRVATGGRDGVLQLRGDAKASCDTPIDAGDVIGRVVAVHRDGRAIPLSGRAARLRYRARAAASHVKALAVRSMGAAFGSSSSGQVDAGSSVSMFAHNRREGQERR